MDGTHVARGLRGSVRAAKVESVRHPGKVCDPVGSQRNIAALQEER